MLKTTLTPVTCLAVFAPMLFAGAFAGVSAAHAPTTGDTFAIRATRVHVGDGTVIENGIVLVSDGRIQEVGKGVAVPKDVLLVEHEGDLSAGLVALRDGAGTAGESSDSTRSVMDTADLSHAFDSDHSDMRRLLEEGVTTIVLAPASGNLVGGLCAVVKPGGKVLARRTQLHLDLGASGLSRNRFPTSYSGALLELDRRFEQTTGPFARAAKGELLVLLEAGTRAETQRAVAFAVRHGLRGSISGSPRVGEQAAEVKAAGLGVVLEVFRPGIDRRTVEGAALLAAAGVPFGFALDSPSTHPASLRLTAAACVRAGLAPEVAFRALTSDAARLAGVADRVGSVRAGLDADLVLWSGDPVDPGSRVVAVYVDGEQVYGGDR